MKVFGYLRVSSDEQKRGASLDQQAKTLREYCRRNELAAPSISQDVVSGSDAGRALRDSQKAILAQARRGDLVLVCKVDRWARDLVFAVGSVRELVASGVKFISTDENIDASTTHGDSQLGLMAWVADQERQRIKDRTVGTRQKLRAEGAYVEGNPPIGYQRAPLVNGRRADRKLHPSPLAPLVRECFERCAAGQSVRVLLRWLAKDRPDIKIDRARLARMLRNQVYTGRVQTVGDTQAKTKLGVKSAKGSGVWVEAHDPIVSDELYAAAQRALDKRTVRGRAPGDASLTANFMLRGFGLCGLCGKMLTGAFGAIPAHHTYRSPLMPEGVLYRPYYACSGKLEQKSCTGRYIDVDRTDARLAGLVLERLEGLRAHLTHRPKPTAARPDHDTKLEAIKRKRAKLLKLHLDELITGAEFRAERKVLDSEERTIVDARAEWEAQTRAQDPQLRADLLVHVDELRKAFGHLLPPERRELLQELAERVEVTAGEGYRAQPSIRIAWREVEALVCQLAGAAVVG